jgi:hypothetical protein
LGKQQRRAYIILVRLLLLIIILVIVLIIVLVVLIIKVLEVILIVLLESEGLAGEPIDGAGNELLLDVLPELVVELETLLDVGSSIVVILNRGLGRGEEVEERLCRNGLLDNAGLLGV